MNSLQIVEILIVGFAAGWFAGSRAAFADQASRYKHLGAIATMAMKEAEELREKLRAVERGKHVAAAQEPKS